VTVGAGGRWRSIGLAAVLAVGAVGISAASGTVASSFAAAGNGLALTPYMGWNTYFGLGTRFDEQTILAEANTMAGDGLRAAGYDYIWLDGGWTSASWPDQDPSLCAHICPMRPAGANAFRDRVSPSTLGHLLLMRKDPGGAAATSACTP
jgi:hypothetical protein